METRRFFQRRGGRALLCALLSFLAITGCGRDLPRASDLAGVLEETRDSPAVVAVWAAYCESCVPQLFALAHLRRSRPDLGHIRLIAVEVKPGEITDQPVTREPLPAALSSAIEDEFRLIVIPGSAAGAIREALDPGWPGVVPAYYFLDTKGRVTGRYLGAPGFHALRLKLRSRPPE